MTKSKKCNVRVKLWFDGEPKQYEIKGRPAQTLLALVEAGKRGVTALELSNTWAFRLSAYIHDLRQGYGMDIITQREEHEDGWHGRYVLVTPVEILNVKNN